MNVKTWAEYCKMSMDSINENELSLKNYQIVQLWNMSYIVHEQFNIPNERHDRKPTLFDFFLETENNVNKFCSDGVSNSSLSSDSLWNEITTVIVSNTYKQLLLDAEGDA